MALTKISTGMLKQDAASSDLNIDAGTLYLDVSNNRVGVATTSPLSKLNVKGSQGNWRIDVDSVSSELQMLSTNIPNTGFLNYRVRTNQFIVDTNGSERMRIDTSGNVGIGTSSPVNGDMLTVAGNIFVTGKLFNGTSNNSAGIDFSGNYVNLHGYAGIKFYAEAAGIGSMTERMRIDSSGNLGIGTASPLAKLHVNAANNQVAVMAGGDVSDPLYPAFGFDGQIGSNGGRGAGMYLPSDGTLAWSTAGSERMRIASSGNVGIGTSSPSEMLQIDSADSAIRVNTTNAANNAEVQLLYNNNLAHGMLFSYHGNSALGYIDNTYPRQSGYSYGDIIFRQSYAGTMTEHMRLTAYDGYLGLFTANPKARLEANLHSGSDSSLMNASSVNDVQLLRAGFGLNAATTSNAGAKWGLRFVGRNDGTYDNTKSAAVYAVSEDALGYNREVGLAFHTSAFDASHAERMRIDADGNVGIGTSSPGYKLHVNADNGDVAYISSSDPDGGPITNGRVLHIRDNYATALLDSYVTTGWTSAPGQDVYIGKRTTSGAGYLAIKNSSGTEHFTIDMVNGYVGINKTSGFTTGGFTAPRLVIKQTANSVWGGINIESSDDDSIIALGATSTAHYIASSYRASGGYKPLVFQTGGSERMRIDSAGNVGIGTTSPGTNLDVYGDASGVAVGRPWGNDVYVSSGYFGKMANGGGWGAGSAYMKIEDSLSAGIRQGTNIDFVTHRYAFGNQTTMSLAANGSVGVGTTSPTYKLEVDGGSAETRLRVSTTGTDADEAGIILANSSKTAFNDGIQIAHGAGITSFRGLTGSLYMAIDGSTSRIGIGTSSPTAKLHIIPGASSGTIPGVRVDKDWGSIDGAMVRFDGNVSGSGDGNVLLVKGGGTRTDVETFEVQNGSGTTFVVKGSGDVGIGTASPGTRLHVVGATTTTGIANNIVASWFLTGSYTQNTWYTLTDRASLISLGYGEGIYQFHCYASCFHAGISLYQTAHIYEEFYLQNVASNGASTHEFRRGPAFGHAVNSGHDAIGLRYRETYGGANGAPLIEWSPKAGGLSNLSTAAGYQLFFYLRRVG